MADYIISSCSTIDVPESFFQERDLHYICFHFELDGVGYRDDLGKSVPFDQFYKKMEEGAMTRTSQVNVEEYIEYFESFLKEGKDVIHIALSSGISGTYNSAMIAKKDLEEKYPDRKLYVVDSLCACGGGAVLIEAMADLRDSGMDIDSLYAWTEENKLNVNHWFFSTDLTFFVRGGRISKTAGFFGNALNICPLMRVDHQGGLMVYKKIRTKKATMRAIVDKMEEQIGNTSYDRSCIINHAACYQDARKVADLIEERFPNLKGKVQIYDIGTTIGSHTGPGTVALFFWGAKRID